MKNDALIEDLKGMKTEIGNLREENLKIVRERNEFENENLKLKDVLYGCPECGLYTCECDDAENDDHNYDSPSQPSDVYSDFPPKQNQSKPLCPASPWTPPPTPPCEGCGGINYGPSPSSLCFVCIPPLESKIQPDSSSSPSRTPPGTPPLQRLGKPSKQTSTTTMHDQNQNFKMWDT